MAGAGQRTTGGAGAEAPGTPKISVQDPDLEPEPQDPYVFGIRILLSTSKKIKKKFDLCCFVTFS